jgi:hypothetical protein
LISIIGIAVNNARNEMMKNEENKLAFAIKPIFFSRRLPHFLSIDECVIRLLHHLSSERCLPVWLVW